MIRVRLPRDPPPAGGCRASAPELDVLAERVDRLRPSHRDPEAFHVEKDEIARALRRLARGGRPRA